MNKETEDFLRKDPYYSTGIPSELLAAIDELRAKLALEEKRFNALVDERAKLLVDAQQECDWGKVQTNNWIAAILERDKARDDAHAMREQMADPKVSPQSTAEARAAGLQHRINILRTALHNETLRHDAEHALDEDDALAREMEKG